MLCQRAGWCPCQVLEEECWCALLVSVVAESGRGCRVQDVAEAAAVCIIDDPTTLVSPPPPSQLLLGCGPRAVAAAAAEVWA